MRIQVTLEGTYDTPLGYPEYFQLTASCSHQVSSSFSLVVPIVQFFLGSGGGVGAGGENIDYMIGVKCQSDSPLSIKIALLKLLISQMSTQ